MNAYTVIDEQNWTRAMHCAIFRSYAEPAFCVTFEVDVTDFHRTIQEQGLSFTAAMVYAVCICANRIEAFRYRFLDGKIVLFDKIDASFTWLNKETHLFKVVSVPLEGDIAEFCVHAVHTAESQTAYFTGPLGIDVFQCSALPWLSYTHISHTNSGKPDCATPLFDWGKWRKVGKKLIMPVSVQAHHSFVDGLHVGQFAQTLQSFLSEIGHHYKNPFEK